MIHTAQPPSVLKKFVHRARRLYSLPAVAMQVIELTGRPQINVRELKECIENDPALTTKILRVVNSSLFGLRGKVSDLNQALTLLGVKPLKLLVLGFSLPKDLLAGVEAQTLARYWRHTLIKAVASRELSEQVWRTPGDEAFIAGLLQDVGVLVLLQDLGDAYATFLDRVNSTGGDLAALETATLGFDHAVLSARLLDYWGLPETLVRAVAQPHRADRLLALPAEEQSLAQILHLAELVALLLTGGRPALLNELLDVGRQYGELSLEQLQALVEVLEEKVGQLAGVLSLQLPAVGDYSLVLREAHAQLSQAADAAAIELVRGALPEPLLLEEKQALSGACDRIFRRGAAPPGAKSISTSERPFTASAATLSVLPASIGLRLPPAVDVEGAVDFGLLGRVAAAVAASRRARCSVSLVFVEIDHYSELIFSRGLDGAGQLVRFLGAAVHALAGRPNAALQTSDAACALILEGCDRQQALELTRRLICGIRKWSQDRTPSGQSVVTISAGVATLSLPSKNFPAQVLVDAAQRCLYGAQVAGGDGLKSIDI